MASTVWKGHLTFGLVSLPVKLYSAARAETVGFNQLHKSDHSRIRQVIYCQAEDKPIPRNEIVKGFEYEKDKYVVVDDEDIKKVTPHTAKTMEVLEFVKSAAVDAIYFESSYYLAPDEAGEKPYALLFEALRRTGFSAVAKIAMHNREHIVVLRPGTVGIVMHTMYYRDEIRQVDEFRTDTHLVKDAELKLATTLIESLAAEFEPEKYRDEFRANVMALVQAKVEGRQTVEPPAPQHLAPVVDILEALKMSLDKVKKPVRSAAEPARVAAVAASAEAATAPKKRSRKA